jgi:hypothetical protein
MLDFCFAPDLPICVCVSVSVCIIITYIHFFQIYIQWFTPSFIIIYTIQCMFNIVLVWIFMIYMYIYVYALYLYLYIYPYVFFSPDLLLFLFMMSIYIHVCIRFSYFTSVLHIYSTRTEIYQCTYWSISVSLYSYFTPVLLLLYIISMHNVFCDMYLYTCVHKYIIYIYIYMLYSCFYSCYIYNVYIDIEIDVDIGRFMF